MTEFEENYQWQAGFLPAVRQRMLPILRKQAQITMREATWAEDCLQATDLLAEVTVRTRIAVRMRRNEYLSHRDSVLGWYGNQVTIRSHIDRGTTELSKVLAGHGDFFFYGFGFYPGDRSIDSTPRIVHWACIDLDQFRQAWNTIKPAVRLRHNPDSDFIAIPLDVLPAEAILHRHTPWYFLSWVQAKVTSADEAASQ